MPVGTGALVYKLPVPWRRACTRTTTTTGQLQALAARDSGMHVYNQDSLDIARWPGGYHTSLRQVLSESADSWYFDNLGITL